jgi:hypothetical protein
MSAVLIFILSIPLSVELCGRFLGLRDVWLVREARPGALLRLIAPILALGLMIWWAAPEHLGTLVAGLLLVPAWQIVIGYAMRLLTRIPQFQAQSISRREKAPATRDWGGERKSSPGR